MEKKQVFIMLGVLVTITLGISLYCIFWGNQYRILFDSNGGSEVESQYVRVGEKVKEPEEPTREGYQFVEWQLNGIKYDFGKKVKRKMTLVAHWQKIASAEELIYKLAFDSDGGTEVEEQEVQAGKTAKKPTDPVKEGYTFEGWFYKDAKFDFSKKISQDVELKAKWKKDKVEEKPKEEEKEPDKKEEKPKEEPKKETVKKFQVGDRVKIVGSYAESSTSKKARHRKAIGWKRVVLKVYDGREYPYRVGNDSGTTGFFKAESLEKID